MARHEALKSFQELKDICQTNNTAVVLETDPRNGGYLRVTFPKTAESEPQEFTCPGCEAKAAVGITQEETPFQHAGLWLVFDNVRKYQVESCGLEEFGDIPSAYAPGGLDLYDRMTQGTLTPREKRWLETDQKCINNQRVPDIALGFEQGRIMDLTFRFVRVRLDTAGLLKTPPSPSLERIREALGFSGG